jgi:C-terminal processing protease CtpA/Prc
MNKIIITATTFSLLYLGAAYAGEEPAEAEAKALAKAEYEQVLQEAERARMEAESVRREAELVAERARETARAQAERERERAETARAETEQMREQRAAEEQEIQRAREELSRAHRELREAQREVARAHAELARAPMTASYVYTANFGDRAVIGVVLGPETAKGVKLVAVSPDGPAEKAGLQTGDVLVSLGGAKLADAEEAAKSRVYQIMESAKAGDEIPVVVERDGEELEFTVVAELREPASWQSVIRIPEIHAIEGVPGVEDIHIETIRVPEIDEERLSRRIEIIHERLAERGLKWQSEGKNQFVFPDGDYEFEFEEFSDVADTAFSEANIFFGLSPAKGLELATLNEGLGAYFKADRGVLVIRANEDNAYTLESGDVIQEIDGTTVDTPSEVLRVLREIEPGKAVEIKIKRDRRNKTLEVSMPENRLGLR